MEKITIGKLAELVGVNLETIRFYQREGILKEPAKRSNGYRYYSEEDASRIIFIKKVKELGFSLKEIDEKINDLLKIKHSLAKLSCACDESTDEMKKIKVMDCFESGCC